MYSEFRCFNTLCPISRDIFRSILTVVSTEPPLLLRPLKTRGRCTQMPFHHINMEMGQMFQESSEIKASR